jgi:hypothetical protein
MEGLQILQRSEHHPDVPEDIVISAISMRGSDPLDGATDAEYGDVKV